MTVYADSVSKCVKYIIPLERYPVKVELENDMQFTIRPLEQKDKVPLAQFFTQISEEDTFYLKENVTAPEVIHGWSVSFR